MSLKRILGTMLATQMAGRGHRRGMGGAAMLGGLGYRRKPRLSGKLGLAALGYMAYRAYRDHQAKTGGATTGGTTTGGTTAGASGASGSGGQTLGGMIGGFVDSLTGDAGRATSQPEAAAADEDLSRDAAAAEGMDERRALLLLRAMIASAYADGALSSAERERIMGAIDDAGGTEDDRHVMEREIANPKSVDSLLSEVSDRETAEEFYLASAAAIDVEAAGNRAHLDDLRRKLGLSKDDADEIEAMAA